jgi:hypothetical protein
VRVGAQPSQDAGAPSSSACLHTTRSRAGRRLIEFERGRPIIVDRPLYRELVKSAIKRTHGCRRYSRVAQNAGAAAPAIDGRV